MKLVHKRYIQEAVELNITAFMNLMVILVPFLLITAVFSRLTVVELNLPALDAVAKQPEKIELQLQLVVRSDEFIIQDPNLGVIQRFLREGDDAASWKKFSNVLLEIKRRLPETDSIALLFEKTVDYKTLIQVMDYVRSVDVVEIAQVQTYELFPNISIGDAPELVPQNQLQQSQQQNPDQPGQISEPSQVKQPTSVKNNAGVAKDKESN